MKTVLLVEDVALNRDLMVQLLEDQYRILQAPDGYQGIELAQRERPDLIIMDLSLPRLDGWEAIRRLKASARTKQIPIVALTAHAMIGDRERALGTGCEAYLTKPINEQALFRTIDHLLQPRGKGGFGQATR